LAGIWPTVVGVDELVGELLLTEEARGKMAEKGAEDLD
jgi:hypothetical protein